MTASRTGAIAIWVVAAVLAVVLVIDVRGSGPPPDRALIPGFDADRVTALAWTGEAGEPAAFRIVRDTHATSGWSWVAPPGMADRETVDAVIAALRGARWQRRTDAAAAGEITTTLTVEMGDTTAIGIGQPLGEQRWITIDDRAELVDGWVAHALDPGPLALRVRHPFAGAPEAKRFAVGSLALAGTPRRIVALDAHARGSIDVLARPELVTDLEHALAEVEVEAIPTTPLALPGRDAYAISIDGTTIATAAPSDGHCPAPHAALPAIAGPAIGPGCVGASAWAAVVAATRAFEQPLGAIVERRPVPIAGNLSPTKITLPDHSVLDLAKRPRVRKPNWVRKTRDVEPSKVAELIGVLALPAEPVDLPAVAPRGTIEVDAGPLDVVLDIYPGGIVARHGEPIALRVGDGAVAILERDGGAYIDPILWTEDPLSIHAIRIEGVRFERGAVIGEWTRDGSAIDKPDAKALDELADLLASPRSLDVELRPAARALPQHAVALTIEPPAGPETTRDLAIGWGGERNRTCVLTDPTPYAVADRICALVTGLAR